MAERKKRETCGCYDRKAPGHKCSFSTAAERKRERKVSRFYAANRIVLSRLDGRWYFVRKAEIVGDGVVRPIGKKHDVTESVEALLKSKKKAKSR